MADLRERFRTSDLLVAPDLWPIVEERLDAGGTEGSLRLVGADETATRRARARKLLTIAAAFAIVALASGWLLQSIMSPEPVSVEQPPVSVFAPIHGWIAFLDQQTQELIAADPSGSEDAGSGWHRRGSTQLGSAHRLVAGRESALASVRVRRWTRRWHDPSDSRDDGVRKAGGRA